jgi:diguanylate cyclase (GGDEF)-like protein
VKNLNANYFGRVRLHWLFVLIVLIAMMPVFFLYFSRLQTNKEAALANARDQVSQLATRAAEVHSDIAIKSRHVLETIAASSPLRNNMGNCDSFLKWVQHLVVGQGITPWITGVFVTNPSGEYLCGTFSNGKSVNLSDRAYFKQMLAGRQFLTSGILTGRMSHRLIIAAALPVYDQKGKLEMVVSLGADLYQLNAIANEANSKFGGRLLVMSKEGEVLANLPHGSAGQKIQFDKPMVIEQLMKSEATTLEVADQRGAKSIYGLKRLPHGQKVAIALSRDSVLAPIERTFRSDLLFLLLVAAGSAAASLIVAEFAVLRGVRILKGAALRLKAGKMGVRVKQPAMVAAELDDLTDTYNSLTAEFERLAYLDRQITNAKAHEAGLPRAVLAIDLDDFKPVNDTYGHAVGDRVLAAAARRIAGVLDERGTLMRLGGDEFVALLPLPSTNYREFSRQVAEEIRDAMEKPLDIDNIPLIVGCSIGLASVPDDASSLAGAMIVADAALYEAKRGGRNRVIENAPSLASEAFSEIEEDHSRWLVEHKV